MGSTQLLTVALDVTQGTYVRAPDNSRDPRVPELRSMGYSGDQTLVCALCYAEKNELVPLIVRSRLGGSRRPHFAHPAGSGPPSGRHSAESVWHLTSKAVLAEWGRQQPRVIDVRNEAWLPNHQRRADVRIVFDDGQQLALEVQASPLTDQEWLRRHNDYRDNGITDLWIWHPDFPPHWAALAAADGAQQLWTMDPDRRSLSLMVAKPHTSTPSQAAPEDDVVHRVRHLPPCIGDELVPHVLPLDELDLTSHGISNPVALERALALELQHEHERMARVQHPQPKPTRPPTPFPMIAASTPHTSSTPTQSVSPPPPVDSAARSQSAWLRLQNAFMAAGHSFEYRDAPRLQLPRARRTVPCLACGLILSPTTKLDDVSPCSPDEHTDRPTGPRSSRTSSSYYSDPDHDQLPLF
ncbi:competence protein CoiA family protein [Nocardia fluminea]|uniref:competence protein CoiA family protein n=1 Tax=Nocardia fluminea TaxID=134984 RepID=UPI0033DB9DCA